MKNPYDDKFITCGAQDHYIGRTPIDYEPERKTSYTFEELEEIYHQENRQKLLEKSRNVRVFAACSTPNIYSLPQTNLASNYWRGGFYKAHMIRNDELKADLRLMWAINASDAADIYFVCCMPPKIIEAVIHVFDFHNSENSGAYLVRKDRIGKGQEFLGNKK